MSMMRYGLSITIVSMVMQPAASHHHQYSTTINNTAATIAAPFLSNLTTSSSSALYEEMNDDGGGDEVCPAPDVNGGVDGGVNGTVDGIHNESVSLFCGLSFVFIYSYLYSCIIHYLYTPPLPFHSPFPSFGHLFFSLPSLPHIYIPTDLSLPSRSH